MSFQMAFVGRPRAIVFKFGIHSHVFRLPDNKLAHNSSTSYEVIYEVALIDFIQSFVFQTSFEIRKTLHKINCLTSIQLFSQALKANHLERQSVNCVSINMISFLSSIHCSQISSLIVKNETNEKKNMEFMHSREFD